MYKLALVVRVKVALPLHDTCAVPFSITWLGDAVKMQGSSIEAHCLILMTCCFQK